VDTNDRVKRPVLERTQPVRSWSTLFSAPQPDGSLNDVVSRSVDLGYRVVDEYIRQGQKAAQRLNDRSYGAQAMAGDAQELAMRMLQYASDFAAVWLEFVQLAAAGNAAPGSTATENGAPPAKPEPDTETPADARVRIQVLSTQPNEVSLDIRPDATRLPAVVHALRAVDPDKPRLTDVSFRPPSGEEPACLRIVVPPGQPAGIYSGLIVAEETSRPVGSVSVRID
jgi:hypothetical protein